MATSRSEFRRDWTRFLARASARLAVAWSQAHEVTRSAVGRSVVCCILVLLFCSAGAASVGEGRAAELEAQCLPPWEFSRVDSVHVDALPARPPAVGPEHLVFSLFMRTYKSVISPVGGRRCAMYPSCSSYAQDAIQNLGIAVGAAAACDRLLRCGNDPRFYRLIRDDGWILHYDPVDDSRGSHK